jgi:hypothetical protein
MKRLIGAVALALMVGACGGTEDIIVHKPTVVVLDDDAYKCPVVKDLPDPATLTDIEVGDLLLKLHMSNLICAKSMEDVRQYYKNAKLKVEKN